MNDYENIIYIKLNGKDEPQDSESILEDIKDGFRWVSMDHLLYTMVVFDFINVRDIDESVFQDYYELKREWHSEIKIREINILWDYEIICENGEMMVRLL